MIAMFKGDVRARTLVAPLVPIFSLFGCAGAGNGVCGSGNAPYWQADGATTVAQGVLVGGASGAAIGGIAGRNLKYAGIGAGAGAALGAGVGCLVAASKSVFASAEDNYDTRLAQMSRLNIHLAERSSALSQQQQQLRADIEILRRRQQSADAHRTLLQRTQDTARKEMREAQELADAAHSELAKSNQMVADAESTYGAISAQATQMRIERDKTKNAVDTLDIQVNTLAATSNSIGL